MRQLLSLFLIWTSLLDAQVVSNGGVVHSGGSVIQTPVTGFQKSRIGAPSGTPLSACSTSLSVGTSYYLTKSVSAVQVGNTSGECFNFPQGVTLDLQGFTVTGVIGTNGNVHGSTLKNGFVRCSYPEVISIATTTTGAVSATGSQTVAVSAVVGMDTGVTVNVDSSTNLEAVVITTVDYTNKTMTAVFTKTHLTGIGVNNGQPGDINSTGCVQAVGADNATASLVFDNLDILNSEANTNARGLYVSWNPGSGSGNVTGLNGSTYTTIFRHSTADDAVGCTNTNSCSRMYDVYFEGQNQNVESTFNLITTEGGSGGEQGIAYWNSAGRQAFNLLVLKQFTLSPVVGDTARGLLADAFSIINLPNFVEMDSNYCIANNNRCFRSRSRIAVIHDNYLSNVVTPQPSGQAIHFYDQDVTSEDYTGFQVYNNTWEACGGTLIFARNGLNAIVRDNKAVNCPNGGTQTGSLGFITTLTTGTTSITFQRNGIVANPNIKFTHLGSGVSTGSTLCQSGVFDPSGDTPTASTAC